MDALTFILLISKRYSSFCQIIGRHFQSHFVSWQNPDVVHPHLTRNMRQHFVAILQLHPEHGVGQCLLDGTVLLYRLLFRHLYK